MKIFVDTNVIAYAYDRDAGSRYTKSVELLKKCWSADLPPYISTQVLQELHATLDKFGYTTEESIATIGHFLCWNVISLTPQVIKRALEVRSRWHLSVWDSSIVAAAQQGGVRELWSEDLQAGQIFDGVTIVNPLV